MIAHIVGLFSNKQDAERAISLLKKDGFNEDDISFILREQPQKKPVAPVAGADDIETQGAILGAGAGLGLGFGAGIAASFASLAIPGLGPLLSAGILIPLFSAAGAAAGGVALTGLAKLSISDEDANVYAEGIKRGGVLVAVNSEDTNAQRAKKIMQQSGAVDINSLRERWQRDGWSRFDETLEPDEKYPAF